MLDRLNKIKQAMRPFGHGLLAEITPQIAGGVINEFFKQWNVDVAKVTEDVQRDRSLWEDLKPDQRKQLADLATRLGNLDFMTAELVIESIRDDFPAVASLFLNWPEAGQWLIKQVDELKQQALSHP
jgi:hypothetical protein